MEKTPAQLQAENERLTNALRDISGHMEAIQKTLGEISDLLETRDDAPITNEDVANLLKKYSAL